MEKCPKKTFHLLTKQGNYEKISVSINDGIAIPKSHYRSIHFRLSCGAIRKVWNI